MNSKNAFPTNQPVMQSCREKKINDGIVLSNKRFNLFFFFFKNDDKHTKALECRMETYRLFNSYSTFNYPLQLIKEIGQWTIFMNNCSSCSCFCSLDLDSLDSTCWGCQGTLPNRLREPTRNKNSTCMPSEQNTYTKIYMFIWMTLLCQPSKVFFNYPPRVNKWSLDLLVTGVWHHSFKYATWGEQAKGQVSLKSLWKLV